MIRVRPVPCARGGRVRQCSQASRAQRSGTGHHARHLRNRRRNSSSSSWAARLLKSVTGKAADRWRGAMLAGFAIVAGLVVDLIVCLWLGGFATGKFWIVWPIAALIILVAAGIAALLQKVLGSLGTLVTVIVVMLFGNPSSGGPTGPPYLPTFWRDIGPFLPSRNAYIHSAAQHPVLPRQRHHAGSRRPPRLRGNPDDRARPDRVGLHPVQPGHPRNRSRGHGHGRPRRTAVIAAWSRRWAAQHEPTARAHPVPRGRT